MFERPIYDPQKTWQENFEKGPFGKFADGEVIKEIGKPQHEFLGYKVYLPFGIAAGPLPTSKHVKAAFEKGFDVNVYKTQRSVYFKPNDFPNVLYLKVNDDLTLEKANKPVIGTPTPPETIEELTITNSFGNPSSGPDFWIEDLKKAQAYEGRGQLLIMSVVGTIKEGFDEDAYYEDFATTAFMAVQTGVKVIEVNLSCPNVATEGVLCYSPDAVEEIVKRVKEKIGNIPLVAKLGYFSADQEDLLKTVVKKMKSFISAISAINTIAAPIVNEKGEQALPGVGRLKSGVCGAAIKWAGIDMVERLAKLRERFHADYQIIGVGGVLISKDYFDYKKAGADSVMTATGAIWNPYLAKEIKKLKSTLN